MNHHGAISVTKNESTKGVTQPFCTALFPIRNSFSVESEGQCSLTSECSTHPSPLIWPESPSSQNNMRASTIQPQKYCFKTGLDSPVSTGSHVQHSKSTFQHSSVFCTSLYLSSSSSSETNRQLGNLPFLPHPSTCNQSVSAVDSTKSPPIFGGDVRNPYDEEHSDVLMKDFLNLSGDASEDSLHGMNFASDNLAHTEQLELQFLSDELNIAITDHGENPRLDVSRLQPSLVVFWLELIY